MAGNRIGGTNINNIRRADDKILIADTEEKLQRSGDGLKKAHQRYKLNINVGKTEVMGVTKRSEPLIVGVNLGGINLRKVNSSKYLGSLVDEDAISDCDIRARADLAKATFGQLRKLPKHSSMGRATRVRVLKAYVWSVLFFGCKAQTICK